jgi:uncharacterized protein (UPF0335 family)
MPSTSIYRLTPRERLVHYVRELEALTEMKQAASLRLTDLYEDASLAGLDPKTLKVVLKLRTMTPEERRERRALESIYMAGLGMLDGDSLTDEARRRLDGEVAKPAAPPPAKPEPSERDSNDEPADTDRPIAPAPPAQPALPMKTAEEARQEGMDAAVAGQRVYDNPYRAGDHCRAAWDEGWCAQKKSNGMEPPAAYARRTDPPKKDPKDDAPKKGDA